MRSRGCSPWLLSNSAVLSRQIDLSRLRVAGVEDEIEGKGLRERCLDEVKSAFCCFGGLERKPLYFGALFCPSRFDQGASASASLL
jgi:hypothetical protein